MKIHQYLLACFVCMGWTLFSPAQDQVGFTEFDAFLDWEAIAETGVKEIRVLDSGFVKRKPVRSGKAIKAFRIETRLKLDTLGRPVGHVVRDLASSNQSRRTVYQYVADKLVYWAVELYSDSLPYLESWYTYDEQGRAATFRERNRITRHEKFRTYSWEKSAEGIGMNFKEREITPYHDEPNALFADVRVKYDTQGRMLDSLVVEGVGDRMYEKERFSRKWGDFPWSVVQQWARTEDTITCQVKGLEGIQKFCRTCCGLDGYPEDSLVVVYTASGLLKSVTLYSVEGEHGRQLLEDGFGADLKGMRSKIKGHVEIEYRPDGKPVRRVQRGHYGWYRPGIVEYKYDPAGRLIEIMHANPKGEVNRTISFSYQD